MTRCLGQGKREDGQIGSEILSAPIQLGGVKSTMWIIPGISSFKVGGPLLFSLERWSLICYRVYASPSISCLRESVVSRTLGYNWWPAVPGVFYPNKSSSSL
jgi:hypothetical protein